MSVPLPLLLSAWLMLASSPHANLEDARNRQDRAALQKAADAAEADAAKQPKSAAAHYKAALAESYLAEVATELRDKAGAKSAAESGIKAAERAVAIEPGNAEYHRILGTLCGQVIPANVLAGLSYGKCARDSINKAIELNPRSALAHVSRGVGNYYLPSAFGGGTELAIGDFQKAIELDPKLAEAHLWLGIALRKAGRNAEARAAIERSVQLNPARVWARQQLEKTPGR